MLITDRQQLSPAWAQMGAGSGARDGRESLTAQAKTLYRSVLRQGKIALTELSSLTAAPSAHVQSTVDELARLGLIFLEDGWITAVPYHHVVDTLLAEQVQILGAALDGVREAQSRLRILIRESAWLGGDSVGTVLATSAGEADAGGYADNLRARSRGSLAAMHPGARFSPELLDNSLKRAQVDLAEGVKLRVVHQSAALSHPRSTEYLYRIEQLGGQVRLRGNLPFRLILIDGESAVCCLQWQDGLDETLLLQGGRMLGLLGRLFETIWVDSAPLGVAVEDRPEAVDAQHSESVLTSQHKEIVRYLADGATDQAIAHSLGITTRTVTRRINEIYQALGVQSRFQAGATARRMGLI